MAYDRLLRPLLFRLDAETAHNLAMAAIARGLVRGKLVQDPRLEVEAMGLKFGNPLGLAAGVDKNAENVRHWPGLGFGFAEIGTVTAHPQPGNPKPRLFRVPQDQAIINRMGFNNAGSEAVAQHLARHGQSSIPLGINLGKSKRTPNEEAAQDYATSFQALAPYADYITVNVSSPNTPGLRDLQNVAALRQILEPLIAMNTRQLPILVKLAPDLHDQDLEAALDLALELGLAGIIATNTTIDGNVLSSPPQQQGGISGRPLRAKSNHALRFLAERNRGRLTLIGVGGIFDGEDLYEKLSLGASVAQVYTGWVYGGPQMPARTLLGLLDAMKNRGIDRVSQIPRLPETQ